MPDSPRGTRILVVDDRPEMAEMVADALSERGYDAVAISSSLEAMHRLRTERFDVLVTDLRMPEVDGLALMRASLELDPSRPVIMMTAHGTLDTAVQASGEGAYHYLTKPFRLDALSRLIEQALGRS
jgi:two-component system, NtrC family, response regulator HydG